MKFVILSGLSSCFSYRFFFRPRGGDDGAQGPGPVSAWRCSLGRNVASWILTPKLRDLQFTAIVVAHELGPLVSFSEGVQWFQLSLSQSSCGVATFIPIPPLKLNFGIPKIETAFVNNQSWYQQIWMLFLKWQMVMGAPNHWRASSI